MSMLTETYRSHVDVLGRSKEVRGFLLTMLMLSRYHLSSRPISDANDVFFHRLARSCDALLALLREPGWEALGAHVERGLQLLAPLDGLGDQREMNWRFRRIYRQYFRSLSTPWSHLAQDAALNIGAWPEPRHVVLAVGPNIGIGDELIFFEAARRLRHRFPEANIEVFSYNRTLWDLCESVDQVTFPGDDQLLPFAHAARTFRRDSSALVFLVEFASSAAYRRLELVGELPRFVYLDTGARTVRVVDQPAGRINEHRDELPGGVYVALDRMLGVAGLSSGRVKLPGPVAAPTGRRARVFVNPFSSKDFRQLPPPWWGEVLRRIASEIPLEVEVFAGVNAQCRDFARDIATHCGPGCRATRLQGEDSVPTIAETLTAALEADLVLGLDTFTAHVGVLGTVPCLTVSFGSRWDAWRVSDNHVLHVDLHASPELVAGLALRLLAPAASPEVRRIAEEIVDETRSFPSTHDATASEWLGAIDAMRKAVGRWASLDPLLGEQMNDTPPEFADALVSALSTQGGDDCASRRRRREVLEDAMRHWKGSNLYHYAVFLSGVRARQ